MLKEPPWLNRWSFLPISKQSHSTIIGGGFKEFLGIFTQKLRKISNLTFYFSKGLRKTTNSKISLTIRGISSLGDEPYFSEGGSKVAIFHGENSLKP